MYTDETYNQLRLFFKFTSQLTSNLPFDYNEKTCQLVDLSILSKLWYFFMLLWLAIRCSYHTFWLLTGFVHGFPSVADTTIEIAFAICTFTACILNTGAYYQKKNYMTLVNQMLRVNKRYAQDFLWPEAKSRGRHWNTGIKYTDGCWLYMKLLTPCYFSSAMTFGMLFLSQPHKRLYYYSYVFGEESSIVYMGLYFLLEGYSICWLQGILYLLWYTQLLYANSTSFWLNQIT